MSIYACFVSLAYLPPRRSFFCLPLLPVSRSKQTRHQIAAHAEKDIRHRIGNDGLESREEEEHVLCVCGFVGGSDDDE